MSIELQQVKQRIGSTRQIQKVTSAMQRVAAARLVNDRRTMESSHLYTERLKALLRDACFAAPDTEHYLLQPHTKRHDATLVVFGSDRGLCGGFNTALVDAVGTFIDAHAEGGVNIIAVGKVVSRRFRRLGLAVERALAQPSRARRKQTIETIAALVRASFTEGRIRAAHLVYVRFVSGIRQEAVIEPFLPIACEHAVPGLLRNAAFEPAPADVMDRLLEELVEQMIDHAFLNSLAAENASRQMAMSRASDNAGEILHDLMGQFRRLRQESITTEMIELAGGGEK
jgi:F-type H+-transporting ATPase subunit gamma